MTMQSPGAKMAVQPGPSGPAPVAYQLYLWLARPCHLAAGALPARWLAAGWYVYTGSARRGLAARVRRHLSRDKRRRWHIDWLLERPQASVEWVALPLGRECALNRAIGGTAAVRGFGASDCRAGCGSHLRALGPRRPAPVPADGAARRPRLAWLRQPGSMLGGIVDELFETLDADGVPAGLVPRDRVHAEGLWHRAVHIWLFDPQGRVFVQRRSPDKDLNPDRWDVACGEHLQPGESYFDAAVRGLQEELGLHIGELEPVGVERRVTLDRPELGVHDYELQQAYQVVTADPVEPASDEVAELRLIAPDELRGWLHAEPDRFSPGFHRDVVDLGLLDPDPAP